MVIDSLRDACSEVIAETVRKSPVLFVIAASIGTVATTVIAVKATPKAMGAVKSLYEDKKEPTKLEIVKAAAPHYIPAALSLTATIVFEWLLYAKYDKLNNNYHLAMLAYGITQEELARRNEKLAEYIGPKKLQKFNEEIANEKRIQRAPYTDNTEVHFTGNGLGYLCWDAVSGRYFRSDKNSIIASINMFNHELEEEKRNNPFDDQVEKELNDLYLLMGLEKCGVGNFVISEPINPYGIWGSAESNLGTGETALTMDIERYIHLPALN